MVYNINFYPMGILIKKMSLEEYGKHFREGEARSVRISRFEDEGLVPKGTFKKMEADGDLEMAYYEDTD